MQIRILEVLHEEDSCNSSDSDAVSDVEEELEDFLKELKKYKKKHKVLKGHKKAYKAKSAEEHEQYEVTLDVLVFGVFVTMSCPLPPPECCELSP